MSSGLPRLSRRGRIVLAVIGALILFFIALGIVVGILTDRLWFDSVGYARVYSTMIWTRITLFVIFGVVVGGVVGGSMYLAYRVRPFVRPRTSEQEALDRYRDLLGGRVGRWIAAITVIVGLFAGASGQGAWQMWMLFTNGGSFGATDPQFHIDIGYYVFAYPFWRYLLGVGFTTVFLALLFGLIVHYLFGGVRLRGEGERVTTAARTHLSVLVASFVALKAIGYVLDRRGTVLAHNGTAADTYGAGYTAVNALLPSKEILAWISVIVAVAILLLANAFVRNVAYPGMAVGLLVLSAFAVDGIYPFVLQNLDVKPNPLNKESAYIARSIDATRTAFGLNDITQVSYDASTTTPPASLSTDTGTVPNIRVLDPAVVADTFTQFQRTRGVYDFGQKLDIDRYTIDGKLQDYIVGVREIDYNSQAGQSWNWQQAHTIYTHGYGLVAAPANEGVCNGLPYFVSGFVSSSSPSQSPSATGATCAAGSDELPVAQPGIYFGENMSGYAVVGASTGSKPVEYNGPGAGSGDAYTTYEGTGGVSVGGFFNRLLYAYQYKEPNFLISSVFNADSKMLYVRDPRDRVQKIAPWLTLDGDPYPAVVNGRIVWILDGYTTASTYPYSQQEDLRAATSDAQVGAGIAAQANTDVNYLHNSVKATVDAYNGTVTLYAFGGDDPIRDAWNKAFGGNLIKPESAIPPELAAHFRYPEDQLKVQRDLLARFHVSDVSQFYSGQNAWQVPPDPASDQGGLKQPPYYLLAQFPGQSAPTFQLVSSMIYSSQQNLSSLISGSYAGDTPHLTIYDITNNNAYGPNQAQQKMNADAAVRRDLSLFQSQTSTVIYGNLLSLPVGNGILYVEPVYLRQTSADAQTYPQLTKVLLSYGDYIAYDNDVASGIADLLAQAKAGTPATTVPPTGASVEGNASPAVNQAVAQINKALDDLTAAQKSGDFTAYGQALDELKSAIAAYQAATGQPPPSISPSGPPSVSPSGTPAPR